MIMTKNEVITNFIDSLERERTILGLTQVQIAQEIKMSVSGYKKLISGETSKVDLYVAYQTYQLTGKWLFELWGDCSSPLLQTVSKMRRLTPSQIRFVAGIIDFEIAFRNETPPGKTDDYVSILIPTGNMEDGMIWDCANVEKLNVASYRKWFGKDLHCAIRITSNHLSPVYHMGDILLVSQTAPRDGDTGIFINKEDGRVYLRRYRQTNPCVLEPIISYGETFFIDCHDHKEMDKWIKFGHVLTKIRE